MNVPVAVLRNWRIPDRDIHRTLALYGPMTTLALQQRMRLAYHPIHNALGRLTRVGVVRVHRRELKRESGKKGAQFHNLWQVA